MDSYAAITGDLALYDKRGKICQWIEDIDAIDTIHSRSPTLVTDEFPAPSENGHVSDLAGLKNEDDKAGLQLKLTAPESVLESEDLDEEDDFFLEAAQQALETGKASFLDNDYKSASAYLKEGLSMSKELSRRPQALCDTWELRRMLGMCAFHVDSPAEAEDALLSVLANAPKNAILSESQRLQVSETAHLLAQVDVRLGKLDQAYRYCEYALRGRRRVLGKNHEQSYESLALMAKVLQLQQNSIRAEFFTGMIPEAEREKYTKLYADLKVPENLPVRQPEQRMPNTPPQSPPVRSHADRIRPPPIPRRSPSRSGADIPRSVPSNIQDDFRPESALSGRVSALSGPVSAPASEAGDGATQISLSPPNSPDMRGASIQPLNSMYPNDPYANSRRLVPGQYPPTPPERPDHKRTLSNRSTSNLPVISEPAIPEGQPLSINNDGQHVYNGTGSSQWQSPPAAEPKSLHSPGMYPQPLRTQRQGFLPELPGDSEFSTPNTPSSEASAANRLKHHQTRDSAYTVSSLRRSPNIALPEQEEKFGQLPPQPQQHHPVAYPPPLPQPIAPDHDHRGRDHAYPPSAPQHSHSIFPQPHPMERPSMSSSSYSVAASEAQRPPVPPMPHTRTEPTTSTDVGKTKRKTTLRSIFRSNSSAPTPYASEPTISDARNTSLTYNGIRLSRKDIDSIKNANENLTDAAIDFWQEYLEHELLQHNPRYLLLRPMRSHLLVSATTPTDLSAALPFTPTEPPLHCFIPLTSPTTNHISLLLISIHDTLACHYDPLSSKHNNRNLASQITTKIANYVSHPLSFIDVPDTPEQIKPSDAGVFVCFYMQHLIGKLQSTHVSQKVDASMKCKTIEAKVARKVILKAVEARRKSREGGGLFEE